MASVRNLCNKGMMLENGMVKEVGEIDQIIDLYMSNLNNELRSIEIKEDLSRDISITKISVEIVGHENETDLVLMSQIVSKLLLNILFCMILKVLI